jgi:D-alanyl-lipoteichoic acid acyltransferase DltB (MBOAT superfamily)
MLFNSFEFLVFFPLVLALYYVLGRRGQNLLLLLASYLFYGWWDWRFCSLLALSTLIDFFCGLAMDRWPDRKRVWLAVSVVAGLGILGFFKYFNFFVDTAALALSTLGVEPHLPVLRIVLPVGISFYTFQTMSYTLDVYRGHLAPTRNLLDFGLYVAFFPQLVAGPIERATHLLKQFAAPRVVTRSMIESGCFLILLGYFRKVVIADGVSPMVETIFASSATAPWHQLVTGAVLFSIQIYGDFAGYSDIARGLSRLLGIQLMVNFKQPYLSRNITEFWRRWHISLSTWLRDYLYIPPGGKPGRHGRHVSEPDAHHADRGTLARGELDVCRLGRAPRAVSGDPQDVARPAPDPTGIRLRRAHDSRSGRWHGRYLSAGWLRLDLFPLFFAGRSLPVHGRNILVARRSGGGVR